MRCSSAISSPRSWSLAPPYSKIWTICQYSNLIFFSVFLFECPLDRWFSIISPGNILAFGLPFIYRIISCRGSLLKNNRIPANQQEKKNSGGTMLLTLDSMSFDRTTLINFDRFRVNWGWMSSSSLSRNRDWDKIRWRRRKSRSWQWRQWWCWGYGL